MMRFRGICRIALGVSVAVPALPAASAAQDVAAARAEAACQCVLQADLLVTLEDLDGHAGLSNPFAVERTNDGRFLVVPANRPGTILLFSESGQFLREVGRPGEGPDEFGFIRAMRVGARDSVFVMDLGNGRLAVLDTSLEVARADRLATRGGWFGPLNDGRTVVLTGIPSRGTEPQNRLVVLNSNLEVENSFLPTKPLTRAEDPGPLRRSVAVSPEGLVAVAHSTAYVIELWQVDGTHVGVIRREPEWFVPGPESGPSGGPGPADPLQESPRLGPDGRLWTVVHVADDDWNESLGPTRSILGGDGLGVPAASLGGYIDSVVEVFDVNSGQLLGSARVDPHLTFISDLGHAYSYREDEYGQPFVDVWQFRIVPKP